MRARTILTSCLVLACMGKEAVHAQTVGGVVVAAEAEAPLAGAEVVLLDRDGDARVRGIADERGAFALRAPGAGRYRVLVSLIGRVTYRSTPFDVGRNDVVRVEVRMGVDAIPLEPFVVVGRRSPEEAHLRAFDERRLNPAGTSGFFLTKEDIERRPLATPTALLRQLPGVSVQYVRTPTLPDGMNRGMIFMSGGGCEPSIFVDGVRTRQSVMNTVDDLLGAAPIAGVEVYPRALAAPLQYQVDSGCGVVLFWTARAGDDDAGWGLKRILAGTGVVAAIVFLGVFAVH